ncbi:zf-HC2 domain-containing protein [Streptomyces sp. NPDC002870]|uniref:zf-HC2 domain-containing protein n=1 Tax=Streptomyces sp. NPDC002870 TaxID=3364666 RepID=UPI0036B86B81
MECEHARTSLAAQVLGILEGSEHDSLGTHLDQCPSCRSEREELLGLLPLLDTVMPYELDGVPTPDPARAVELARGAEADRDDAHGPSSRSPQPQGQCRSVPPGGYPGSSHTISG